MNTTLEATKPWLVIRLGDSVFGVSANWVQEMVSMPLLSSVPNVPSFIRGVMNLRGKVLPLIDLRERLGMVSAHTENQELIAMLQQREQDHRNWLRELRACIDENRPFTLATDPHQCAFGKWYDAYRTENLMVSNLLAKFDAPHARIHGIAQEAISLQKKDKVEAARQLIQKTESTDLAVVAGLFENLRRTLADSSREIALVLKSARKNFAVAVDAVESVETLCAEFEPLQDIIRNSFCQYAGTRLKDKSHILILEPDAILEDETIAALEK
ncbi:MAG TPA: chemotaxis protein CheW [Candidatus Hydrogenedentes bacterium]|nr:chemotaxis protein CheW [Candidatus Hydrogenedentota bacterium]